MEIVLHFLDLDLFEVCLILTLNSLFLEMVDDSSHTCRLSTRL